MSDQIALPGRHVSLIVDARLRECRRQGVARDYAVALYNDPDATLDDLREAVTTLEDAQRIARRVMGGTHPSTVAIERVLELSRRALRAREGTA